MKTNLFEDLADISTGLKKLNVAIWLASEDMRSRYARTALGPWWNVLSTVVFVLALGITFGALFGQPLEVFLPYLAASMACWNFMNSIVQDGPMILIRANGIIQAYPLPLSTQIFRSVADKSMLMAHFLLVYVGLAIYLKVPITIQTAVMFIPAAVVYVIAAIGVSLAFSVLGARFRDLGPALSTIMTMAFLLTPVFWQKVSLKPEQHWITDLNPFFHLLEIGRQPLLGQFAPLEHWIASIGIAAFCLIAGSLIFAIMRRKIYYWL
ncbi:MAG: ABC transporter permease [Hyphomonadaceae bacterium]|jgi:ABC-type polysaccharide/polyol phosphate export permease|nr:ABC transporter permease [Hyphomonadaceae bacterium]MCZ8195496.1 ABC transporter permease [Aquidulcibacter sp.]